MDINQTELPTDDSPTRFNELNLLVSSLEGDFRKFFIQGNKAAGTRIRQGMQALKVLAQDVRIEVQSMKNTTDPS